VYCSPSVLDLENIVEVLLQKSSLTLTDIALVHVRAMAFGLTVPGIVSDVATVTKGAGPWRSVNLIIFPNRSALGCGPGVCVCVCVLPSRCVCGSCVCMCVY